MFSYQWNLGTLALLTVLLYLTWYWKSSILPSPPFSPPITSLQGMPLELSNNVYEFVAINTSMQAMRVVSGKKLVAAYEKLHAEHHTFKNFVHAVLMRVPKFVAINTLLKAEERRPASYNERIAAYEQLDAKGHIVKLLRTDLKWYLGLMPMPNASVPVPAVDVTSILPLATALHPLNITSRQLRAEFQSFD
jgi:hypothetical protein